jgi:hypothetical protein
MNLTEISEDPLYEIHRVGPLGIPGQLDSDPRRRRCLRLIGIPCFLFAHGFLVPLKISAIDRYC